jgi:hypothetical protein
VMIERYGDQMRDMNMIIKGDDFISDKIPVLLPVMVQEIRDTQLTEQFNAPPYHAGRFFLDDDVVPDPVRMLCKCLVKRTNDLDRAKELSLAFYDRYVPLSEISFLALKQAAILAYSDFEPELVISLLELYHAMRDRTLFFDLVYGTTNEGDILRVLDSEDDCARFAASFFSKDENLLRAVQDEDILTLETLLAMNNIPVFRVRGRKNDFLKRGVWLTEDHAWAVVGLTEVKDDAQIVQNDFDPNLQTTN